MAWVSRSHVGDAGRRTRDKESRNVSLAIDVGDGRGVRTMERLTEEARRVIALSEDEASGLGNRRVRAGHVLLGLLAMKGSGVAAAFASANVYAAGLRDAIEPEEPTTFGSEVTADDGDVPEVPFSPELKRLFEDSLLQAVNFGREDVAPEHLLLALLGDEQSGASAILSRLGADVDQLRKRVNDIAVEQPTPSVQGRLLDAFATNLTAVARARRLDPVVGRREEIERVVEVLGRRRRNVPVLVAEPGINKMSIVEGLALAITDGTVPAALQNKDLFVMHPGIFGRAPVALGDALRQAAERHDVVLFLEELHEVLSEASGDARTAASLLKEMVVRGGLPLIGATTRDDYRALLADDPDIAGLVEDVPIEEVTVSITMEILRGVRDRYEAHHRLTITDGAFLAAAILASRYIRGQFLPDSAVDVIDAAAARRQTQRTPIESDRFRFLETRLSAVRLEKEAAIEAQKFDQAAKLRDLEMKLDEERSNEELAMRSRGIDIFDEVTEDHVVQVVARRSGVSVERLGRSLDRARARRTGEGRARDAPEPQYVMLVDQPLESRNDDVLGTGPMAEGIASMLSRTPTPFVLALDGGWGVGKSTLLRQIEQALPAGTRTVRFNAWTAHGENALEALIKSVLLELDKNLIKRATGRALKQRHFRAVAWLGTQVVASFIPLGRLVDDFWARLSVDTQSRNELREAIQRMLRDWVSKRGTGPPRKLAVLIDDLDRCTDDVVVSVCEAVKLYLDAPGLIFVIGCDLSVLARGVAGQARGGVSQGRVYLEKIVQVAYRVPAPDKATVVRLIGAYAERSGTTDLVDGSITEILAESTGRNPRRVKRILNSFVLEYHLNPAWRRPPLTAAELMTAVLLQHLYPSFYEFILRDESAKDAIGDFLDYADVRGTAANPPPPGDAWWSTAGRVFRKYSLSQPKRRGDDRGAMLQELGRLEQLLPDDLPALTRDEMFLSLLREIGDAETRRAVHAQLVSRPLGTEAPSEAVVEELVELADTGPAE